MSPTWEGGPPPDHAPIRLMGWVRVVLRGIPILCVLGLGLVAKALVRLVERPLHGETRPVSPMITVTVCRIVLALMGLRLSKQGQPLKTRGAQVSNHTTWLDIFVLNALGPLYFVSKSEVAGWPGIGLLARVTGTLFISRDRRAAAQQTKLFQERLLLGHHLLFFPEGTSTDGQQVLPFKTTLFAAFYDPALVHALELQAISVTYTAPKGEDARFYGWWGDMGFAPGLLQVLAQAPQGTVRVVMHPPVRVDAYANRKSLAQAVEDQVRAGHRPDPHLTS